MPVSASDPPLPPDVRQWDGLALRYDSSRPPLPDACIELVCDAAGVRSPSLVVDLGSGTGLSSRPWVGRADRIVGVEPNDELRALAEARGGGHELSYASGDGAATGLPAGEADVVTAVQSLHWMDPEATFAEVDRLLRPGGVFAAVDCDYPPFVDWEIGRAWERLARTARRRLGQRRLLRGRRRLDPSQHAARLSASRRFRGVADLALHERRAGSAAELVALATSQSAVARLLELGDEPVAAALAELERAALAGAAAHAWSWIFRVRLALK